MRSILSVLLLSLLFVWPPAKAQASYPAHVDTALSYVGTIEHGSNRGPEINKFLRSVNLRPGNPWCSSFVSYDLNAAHAKVPKVRSGLAINFITRNSISAKSVLRGSRKVKPGYLEVWQHGHTIHGHIGIVLWWKRAHGEAVEGNTFPNSSRTGPQGVWVRYRTIEPGNHFRITYFTPVTYQ